jgi:hypothetical protein
LKPESGDCSGIKNATMNYLKKIIWLICVTAFLPGVLSCKNAQTSNENQTQAAEDTLSIPPIVKESVTYLLPSPGEVLLRFYKADLQYRPELLNKPGNRDKYLGSVSQSLNLGVFITDMAYSALFERSSETVNYLETIQALSSDLGISSSIFESLITRSKANAGRIDSLVLISNEAYNAMIEFLETGGKETTIAYISAGAYIESLYIAVNSIDNYKPESDAAELLVEMKYPMDNLLEKTKTATDTESDKTIVNYLNQVSQIFNDLDVKNTRTEVSEEQKGQLTIKGGDEPVMDESSFTNLKVKATEIRKSVVSFQ